MSHGFKQAQVLYKRFTFPSFSGVFLAAPFPKKFLMSAISY